MSQGDDSNSTKGVRYWPGIDTLYVPVNDLDSTHSVSSVVVDQDWIVVECEDCGETVSLEIESASRYFPGDFLEEFEVTEQ